MGEYSNCRKSPLNIPSFVILRIKLHRCDNATWLFLPPMQLHKLTGGMSCRKILNGYFPPWTSEMWWTPGILPGDTVPNLPPPRAKEIKRQDLRRCDRPGKAGYSCKPVPRSFQQSPQPKRFEPIPYFLLVHGARKCGKLVAIIRQLTPPDPGFPWGPGRVQGRTPIRSICQQNVLRIASNAYKSVGR